MEIDNTQFFVIGADHHNTLGVVRSLGDKGILSNLIICGADKSFVAKSKFAKSLYILPSTYGLTTLLQKLAKDIEGKGVIISCTDAVSQEIDSHREQLDHKYFVPGVKNSNNKIAFFENKENQRIWAEKNGLLTPKSYILAANNNLDCVKFPCIVKPLSSVNSTKAEIKICNNTKQLKIALSQSNHFYQVQEFIKKSQEFQLIGVKLGDDVIIPGYTDIIRQPDNTNTGYLKYIPFNWEIVEKEKIIAFLDDLGYDGLFSIEFISDKSNIYFMEINMRNDGNAYVVTKAGINLPYLWCCYCLNLDINNEPKSFNKAIYFMPELSDVKNIGKKVGLFKWLCQFYQAEAHAIWNLSDPSPFFYYLLYRLGL